MAWRICAIPILCGVSNTSLIACRSSLTTSSCSELLSRTTGSCASGPRAPLLPLVCNQVKVSTSYFLYFLSPGQEDLMQSSTSTDSPTHVPMPLHPRALILDPVPHVTEHWAHSLQSCHTLSIPQSKCKQILPPLENFVPAQTSKLQLRVSVLSPGQVSSPPGTAWRHARALNSKPGPQVAVHGDHSPQSCHSVTISRKEKVKQ